MTISSIYANQPGTVGSTGEKYTPDARGDAAGKAPGSGTLQEMTDQAKLSSLAPRIQAVLSEIAGSENNVLNTLSANVEKLQEGFIDTLYTTLSENGVDLTQKMTLRLDRNNSLTVAGEHPEKERMDAILSENPALSTAFGEIASQSEVLRDLTNINKVMTRHTGMEAYTASGADKSSYSVYQMSLKGDMSHFYFSRT
ncbi:conserved hypothetical protein [uncultured delta proteobacterium]|uniref:Flagellar hook-associated protein 1 n=1 Tax=uncultured delta proteobacterium TaxID=34034 RepID=A0A212J3U5_9DELT|nr:conserved hypothetical protein [uncultured delta proteobacterium]